MTRLDVHRLLWNYVDNLDDSEIFNRDSEITKLLGYFLVIIMIKIMIIIITIGIFNEIFQNWKCADYPWSGRGTHTIGETFRKKCG